MTDNSPSQAISTPEPPPVAALPHVHPLERPDDNRRAVAAETARIRLAWAKLVWLLAFLALLLAISYLVPYIAEQTQYAITRGKQRAEREEIVWRKQDDPPRERVGQHKERDEWMAFDN